MFFKAVCADGSAPNDASFVYTLRPGALSVHEKPNRTSKEACGRGIHVAKTVEAACVFAVRKDLQIWVVEPGEILGEDDHKARTDRIRFMRLLTEDELASLVGEDPVGRIWWLYYYARDVRGADRAAIVNAVVGIAHAYPELRHFEDLFRRQFNFAKAAT